MGEKKDSAAEAARKARIRGEISSLKGKVSSARTAKGNLQADKNELDGYITSFETSDKKLTGDYLDIKISDVFEGHMADLLKAKIQAVDSAISTDLGYAKSLSSELGKQISAIESKIGSWESQIRSLEASL